MGDFPSAVSELSSLLDVILTITDAVYTDLMDGEFQAVNSKMTKGWFLDNLYMSAAITDNDIVAVFTTLLWSIPTKQSCTVKLEANGKLSIMAETLNKAGVQENDVRTPSLAVQEFAAKAAYAGDIVLIVQGILETTTAGIVAFSPKKTAEEEYL